MEAPNAPNPETQMLRDIKIKIKTKIKYLQAQPQLQVLHNQSQQPAPAGMAPQIFYQNWVGKKPEYSGKPEEDAESHLLSTRDRMEVHNFPEGEKVRHFRVTLIGEARLWYESLAPLDNDWPTLQNKFRWQYSKIGNTPEQLFHAWRTFKFHENTDSVDSYILRMIQVTAMLNYGEMQILENFKNTLPYQLYSMLINVNNLRDAIDLAKRVLTKEKLDRQLTRQSSTPFMKVTSNNDCHSPQNQQKKGVTFDAMETLERYSDCIDRLTTLVSDLKLTMDRKQPKYKPKIYQGRSQNQNAGQPNFTPRNRSFSRGRNQGSNRGNYNNRNNYRQNYRNRSRGRWNNHRSGDRSGNYPHYNRHGNMRPHHRQNTQWTSRNRSLSRSRNENHDNDRFRGRSRDRNQRR